MPILKYEPTIEFLESNKRMIYELLQNPWADKEMKEDLLIKLNKVNIEIDELTTRNYEKSKKN